MLSGTHLSYQADKEARKKVKVASFTRHSHSSNTKCYISYRKLCLQFMSYQKTRYAARFMFKLRLWLMLVFQPAVENARVSRSFPTNWKREMGGAGAIPFP
jgi:hypothetical protein